MKGKQSGLLLVMAGTLCLALLACTGGTKTGSSSVSIRPSDGPGNSGGMTQKIEYKGTASTTITYLDISGNAIGRQTFYDNVSVGIGPPQQSGNIVESNPCNLFLGPVLTPTDEGQISIFSAIPFTDPRDGVQYLLQYWTLRLNGNHISGLLSDTHLAEASVMNFLNANKELVPGRPEMGTMVWPYPISKNAKLEGTFNMQEIKLRIQGNVSDESRAFTSTIVANRTS